MNDLLFDLSEKIVLVTGASGNLGAFYSEGLLSRNAHVIGVDLRESRAILELSDRYPGSYSFFQCDVTDKTQLKKVLDKCVNSSSIPNCLINNAALDSSPSSPASENGPFENYPETSWDQVIEVNLKGVFLCCQIFGGKMAETGGGSIVNIGSIYGVVSPDQNIYEYRRKRGEEFYKPVAYSASKSGVYNLTRYLASYWGKKNVRVNTLTLAGLFADQDEEFLQAYKKRIPIGRMADGSDYVGPVVFLCSDASKYMTGSNMTIDGGWTCI